MDPMYHKLAQKMHEPQQQEATIAFLTERIGTFLKKRERVLICLPDTPGGMGWLIEQAVRRCEGIPSYLGNDRRWKNLIRTAFSSRCTTIVAQPLVVLGLSKLTKAMGVPLFIRNAILSGYPCMPWMREGMRVGLDCRTYGSFDPMGLCAGFVCYGEKKLYLRDNLFDARSLDSEGNIQPDGTVGELELVWREDPGIHLPIGFHGSVSHESRRDGTAAVGLAEMSVGRFVDPDIATLSGHLHRWTSILDCRITRGSYGLEMEIVTFPGEKLPKLPSSAKRVVRAWDPETEIPFGVLFDKNHWENH